MLTIELLGIGVASCGGTIVTTRGGRDPIGPLARELIEQGCDPEGLVTVVRSGMVSFNPTTLASWAAYNIVDDDKRGLLRRRWKPFEGVAAAEQDTQAPAVAVPSHT